MTLTVAQIISIAKVSQYLCTVDIEKTGLYAGGTDLNLPRKLYSTRKDIEYQYELDPSNEDIAPTAAYLYALCGKYGLYAQAILLNPGTTGGTISRTAPSPYQFTVDASTSFIIDGQSSKTITAFIGYNLIFIRGGITQSTVNPGDGSSYYSYTKATGSFTMYPAAATGELIGLFPI